MSRNEELSKLNEAIAKWQQKRDELANWMQTNYIDHPEFEAKFREQSIVIQKINQLKARKEPAKCEAVGTYTIPPRQPRNRF